MAFSGLDRAARAAAPPPARVLEIGSWEGRSALFFLNYLPRCRLTCIDPFDRRSGAQAAADPTISRLLRPGSERRFDANIADFADRIEKIKAPSPTRFARTRHCRPPFRHRLYRRQPSSPPTSMPTPRSDLAADGARRPCDFRRLSMGRISTDPMRQSEARHRRFSRRRSRASIAWSSADYQVAISKLHAEPNSHEQSHRLLARPPAARRAKPSSTAWCGLPAPRSCELIAREGFAAVTIDQQHGMWDTASTAQAIAPSIWPARRRSCGCRSATMPWSAACWISAPKA